MATFAATPAADPVLQACLAKCPDGGTVVCATFEKEHRNLCVANCHKAVSHCGRGNWVV
jgi:hypothetical protein